MAGDILLKHESAGPLTSDCCAIPLGSSRASSSLDRGGGSSGLCSGGVTVTATITPGTPSAAGAANGYVGARDDVRRGQMCEMAWCAGECVAGGMGCKSEIRGEIICVPVLCTLCGRVYPWLWLPWCGFSADTCSCCTPSAGRASTVVRTDT